MKTAALDHCPGAELNSHLLNVFHERAARLAPAEVLKNYRDNRFVKPAMVDAVALSEFLLAWLREGRAAGFEPLELSPVAPFGSCSAVAAVHQNKVLTALRGTEVLADATNVLALESSARRQAEKYPAEAIHFCAAHRHLRTQVFDFPGFTPHFSVFCLTSAGRDVGHFQFEKENLLRHLRFYQAFLREKMGLENLKIRLTKHRAPGGGNAVFEKIADHLRDSEPSWAIETLENEQPAGRGYYQNLQFKILAPGPDGQFWDIADGGFTNWTARLTGNQKERLLISGAGAELLFKYWK